MLQKVLGSVVLVASLVLGNAALAQGHDHDEFPEGTLLALEGKDAISKQECALFVMDVGFTGPEQTVDQWYATVLTSYSHGGDAAAAMTVQVHPTKPGTLFGTGANGQDQIVIFLDPQSVSQVASGSHLSSDLTSQDIDLRQAKSFNLKWLHGDHFHTNRCMNLQAHQD